MGYESFVQLSIPILSRQQVWKHQGRAGLDVVVAANHESFERLAKLARRCVAGDEHRAGSCREAIVITNERDENALKARKVGDSQEPCLTGSDHLACGKSDTESISPRALEKSMIAPAAAADASHATAMSPDLMASRRTSTAFAASFAALNSSA